MEAGGREKEGGRGRERGGKREGRVRGSGISRKLKTAKESEPNEALVNDSLSELMFWQ